MFSIFSKEIVFHKYYFYWQKWTIYSGVKIFKNIFCFQFEKREIFYEGHYCMFFKGILFISDIICIYLPYITPLGISRFFFHVHTYTARKFIIFRPSPHNQLVPDL